MDEDLADIQYSPIREYNFAQYFKEVQFNDKTLSETERKGLVAELDETIAQFSVGLPLMHDTLESTRDKHDEFHEINRTVVSVIFFVLTSMIDILVACKYFVMASADYDRRFMRGKLMVILNEGFKRLYGFDEKTHKKSEWKRLLPLLDYFPEIIRVQYYELTVLLEKRSKTFSWWKEERNVETHLDAEKLYDSRQEEIIESRVMMDSMKLFDTLLAVDDFLTNVNSCIHNFLVEKYKRGEITPD